MIEITCAQGSEEWVQARLGIPTASCFDKILTPKTMKPSGQADAYLDLLLSEWVCGRPYHDGEDPWMRRGSQMETEAVSDYEFDHGVETRKVGIVLRDDRLVGASPDRLVGEDGLLEVKCPKLETHMAYRRLTEMPGDYRCQVQGQLWITGREWCDFLSHNPRVKPVVIRVARDEKFIKALSGAVDAFVERLLKERERLVREGVRRGPMVDSEALGSYGKYLEESGLTDADYQEAFR